VAHRDDILEELRKLYVDIEYTEKSHFAAAEHLRALHYLLGGLAAIASAAASAAIVKSSGNLGAVLALISALAAALLTFVKPQGLAEQHVACARELGDLKRRVGQCRQLDGNLASGHTDAELRDDVAKFTAEKHAMHQGAPTTGPVAFWRARRKMNAGHFDHGNPDGESPVGPRGVPGA
jgi:hypothetical protein